MHDSRIRLADRPGTFDDIDFEGTEERLWSRTDVREYLNICPVISREIEGPDLLSVGRKQCYGSDRGMAVGDYI